MLLPLQGVTNERALTPGVASLALGYALVGLSARPRLNQKLQLVNSFKMRSVFLRNDIGMSSELSSAKMERVLSSLRVQSYNTKKRIPNFSQIRGVSKC